MESCSVAGPERAIFEFDFDQEFFLETFRRRNRASRAAGLRMGGRILVGLGIVGLVALLVSGNGRVELWILLGFAVLILFSPQFDTWLTIRNYRRSPFQNERLRVCLGEDAYAVTGSISNTKLSWDAFTRVVPFEDGLLLFQGPGLFNWLPYSALTSGTPEEVVALVSSRVSDFRKK